MIKSIPKFFILILLISCSQKNDNIEKSLNSKILFEQDIPITTELNPNLKIKRTNIFSNRFQINTNTNNTGNLNFEPSLKNKKIYKFSKIKNFISKSQNIILLKNNNLVFYQGNGTIFKLDNNFKEIFKVNHYNKKEKKLNPNLFFSNYKSKIIVADTLSNIYAFDSNNGKMLWKKENNSPFNSNIVSLKDRFIVIDLENIIRCYSILNGEELWNFRTNNSFVKSKKNLSIVVDESVIYALNTFGDLTALNINDGSLVWQTPTQSDDIILSAFSLENSDLVLNDNNIYFSNNKNTFFSIDKKTGIVKWKKKINSSQTPTIDAKYIYTISNEGYLFILEKNSGNILRITNLFKNYKKRKKIKPTDFIVANNKLYLSLNNGDLVKLNINNSLEESKISLKNSTISKPLIFGDNMYVLKNNGIIRLN